MCELLGMSANVPTDICFSFTGFLHRGGGTGPHRDGWGIAFYEAGGYRDFRDPHPSVRSPIARLITDYPIKSHIAISHIRQANVGGVRLANTHPFTREMWGRTWCYAHNGQLKDWQALPLNFYRPVGDTDSEHAFCWLLATLREHYPEAPELPTCNDAWGESHRVFWRLVHRLCETLRDMGVFNMLLADGEFLYTYCSTKLAHITRRAPFGGAELSDAELTVNFAEHTTRDDIVSVIATEPLTSNEAWARMEPGELLVWRQGRILARVTPE
ncbi:class II glutamine amidotransferase [Billgrantia saliphila]|uniref:class II glutamine amidotransferase n=1 Tax=Billgrantia saliphila TaxID=1848458 RepID=UPI000CE5408A|nr:class II glutamine amidotransferase [Halomonas saliphila]